ncbi:hypothetical protein ACFQ5X_48855 [Streptomyces kaempferi]|uniref:Uncharacterized protein n=1 Tax=Streptomyces kaempferi TaxID=333725 RepID=A0ABW3XVJ1_9ACTN
MSGSAGGRAEQDLPRQAPHRAADPSAWLHQFKRLRIRYEIRADLHLGLAPTRLQHHLLEATPNLILK